MSKIQEYKKLTENIRIARARLADGERKITSYQDVYNLSGENKCEACITKFAMVKLPDGQINEDGGYEVRCEHLFCNQPICNDLSVCDFAKQYDRFCYTQLKRDLDDAIAARREFLIGLFNPKKNSK